MTLEQLDYLTREDAAEYCRISLSQFKKERRKFGLVPITHMGKKLYRKADLQRSIEREAAWQRDTSATDISTSITQRRKERERASRLGVSRRPTPR